MSVLIAGLNCVFFAIGIKMNSVSFNFKVLPKSFDSLSVRNKRKKKDWSFKNIATRKAWKKGLILISVRIQN